MPQIEVNGTSTYYEDSGKGHPLVLIHGGGLDSGSWRSQTAYLSEKYRVITYDIRGHGRTEVPEGSYSMDDYVEDLRQLLDRLEVQQTYLAGFSIGGYIALSFTLCYPERVDALILAGTNSGPTIDRVVKKSEEILKRIRSTKGNRAAMKYLGSHEANAARPDLTDRLSEIERPVLIIVGDRDVAAPPYISEEMHRRIANSQMVVIPDSGHSCNEEQPDIFNAIVSDFLQGLEAA
ncbi:alpha/beta fold hydrolase [Chloroflexota bacterium]